MAVSTDLADFLLGLIDDGSWIARRVERVAVRSTSPRLTIERRTSVHLDLREVLQRTDGRGLDESHSTLVPLGLLPKAIYQSFDVRGSQGEALPLHSRWTDSAVSSRLLERAVEWDGLPEGSASLRLKELMFNHCHSMTSTDFWGAVKALEGQTQLEEEWIAAAENSDFFLWLLDALGPNFLALTETRLSASDAIIKIRRVEEVPDRPNLRQEYENQVKGPLGLVAFDVPDYGWPTSDHLRVDAPEGTFLTDSLIWSEGYGFAYQSEIMRGRSSFYSHTLDGNAGTSPVTYVSNLWPSPRGAMRPMMLLTVYVSVILFAGAALEFATQWRACGAPPLPTGFPFQENPSAACLTKGFLWGLASSADAVFSIVFLAPSLLIAYVLRDRDTEIRRDLLESWQHSSLGVLAPAWLASSVVLSSRELTAQWFIGAVWLVCGLVALILTLRVGKYWRDVSAAYRISQGAQGPFNWNTLNVADAPG